MDRGRTLTPVEDPENGPIWPLYLCRLLRILCPAHRGSDVASFRSTTHHFQHGLPLLADYLAALRDNRATGAPTDEISFYTPLASLLNAVGSGLDPRCAV